MDDRAGSASEPDSVRVRAWADGHDADSLSEIRIHRDALLEAARSVGDDAAYALALGRLVDLEGPREDVRAALTRAATSASGRDASRLALALAFFSVGGVLNAQMQWKLNHKRFGTQP